MLRLVPDDIDALRVHGGRGGSEAVELMPRERCEWKVAAPGELSVLRAEAEHGDAAGFVAGAGEEDVVAPENGRGMSGAGKFDLPVDVGVGDPGRDGLGVADAGTVRSAEAGPLLRLGAEREASERGDNQSGRENCFHAQSEKEFNATG